jgi:lipoyl(octanoyl) transferase
MLAAPLLDLGLVDYLPALQKQKDLVEEVFQTQETGRLIFCTHPSIVTLGRKTDPLELKDWTGETCEINRGGRSTYHGPSQSIVYPIVNLAKLSAPKKAKDIDWYLRQLEKSIVQTLAHYQIKAETRKPESAAEMNPTGVWVGDKKIASIGIAISRWVTSHGLALNVDHDPLAFQGISPCGYSSDTMTSMQALVGKKISRLELNNHLKTHLLENLF